MKPTRLVATITAWTALLSLAPGLSLADFPGPEVPAGLGVNIHFADHPQPGEVKMLVDGGFGMARTGTGWDAVEREKGVYDFAAYDHELKTWQEAGIKPLCLLCYGNKLYGNPMAASNEESRAAFAKWASALARRYAGRGIIWEIWNEPNYKTFWPPEPNVDEYTKLALAASQAIHEVAPDETVIGPASSMVDLPFIEACCKAGLLNYWSGISVHPYRPGAPESVTDDYRKLRLLIARYAPAGKKIAIISSEWGYTTSWEGMTADLQGKMLPRQWLVNMSCDVPVSIWYDWRNDSANPKDDESNFGTVEWTHHPGREPVYDPKPAYLAAKTLTQELRGYRYNKRLALDSPNDWVLLFTRGSDVKLVAWTAAAGQAHRVVVPTSAGKFAATSHLGQRLPELLADEKGMAVDLTDGPQYLMPLTSNEYLTMLATWTPLKSDLPIHAPAGFTPPMEARNTSGKPIKLYTWAQNFVTLAPGESHATGQVFGVLPVQWPVRMRQELHVDGYPIAYQDCLISATNPLMLTALPAKDGLLPVQVDNPSEEPFSGRVVVLARGVAPSADVKIAKGQAQAIVVLPFQDAQAGFGLRLTDEQGNGLTESGRQTYRPVAVDLKQCQLVADGDPKVVSEQSTTVAAPPAGLPVTPNDVIRIDYRFDAGAKMVRLVAQGGRKAIEGQPSSTGIWVYCDGSGNAPRMRYYDATGQCFQVVAPHMNSIGWRYIVYPMDGSYADHWGGANDGKPHYPLQLDTLLQIENVSQKPTKGSVYVTMPTMAWPAK